MWQAGRLSRAFVRQWAEACEDLAAMRRCKWGDQAMLSLISTWYSLHMGHRVPYLRLDPATVPMGKKDCTPAAAASERERARARRRTSYWGKKKLCTPALARQTVGKTLYGLQRMTNDNPEARSAKSLFADIFGMQLVSTGGP